MTTYAELYYRVQEILAPDTRFSIAVETFNNGRGPETEWSIFLPGRPPKERSTWVGSTAKELLQRFESNRESIGDTSKSVGHGL